MKGDLSGYCWLKPSPGANAKHTADTLAQWNTTFTTPSLWICDQGSHLKNEVIGHIALEHNIIHFHTVSYYPWTYGTVKQLIRPILASNRATLAELKLSPQDWTRVIRAIASALHEAPLPRFGTRPDGVSRSPVEVMIGIQLRRPVLRIIPENHAQLKSLSTLLAHAFEVIKIT